MGGVLLTTSLQAKPRCGIFAGILSNKQSLSVLTYGDAKTGANTYTGRYSKIRNGKTSKNYGICDADFFWAPKQTYGFSYFTYNKVRQFHKNQKVKISAFTTTCKKYDYKDIICSSLWWWG